MMDDILKPDDSLKPDGVNHHTQLLWSLYRTIDTSEICGPEDV